MFPNLGPVSHRHFPGPGIFPEDERTAVAFKSSHDVTENDRQDGTLVDHWGTQHARDATYANQPRGDKARTELASAYDEGRDGCIGSDDSSLERPVVT